MLPNTANGQNYSFETIFFVAKSIYLLSVLAVICEQQGQAMP